MEVLGVVGMVLLVLLLFTLMAYAVVAYVVSSKALHEIAARRGIENPWLAWVPVAGFWLQGKISDQYRQRKYGYDPEMRKTLLTLAIVTQAGSLLIDVFDRFYNGAINFGSLDMAPILIILIIALAVIGVEIALLVYRYKAQYDLFASCKPKLAVLFLVLSIVTPAGPFLTYACRNSDDGLPVQTEE